MQRPNVVTIIGILNIVFGAFGLLALPVSLLSIYWLETLTHVENPMRRLIEEDPFVRSWTFGSMAIGCVSTIVLIVAGAGLLGMKRWGRRLSLLQAGFSIAFGLAGMVVNFTAVVPALLRAAENRGASASAGALGGAIGGAVGGIIGLGYPAVLLLLLTRANVRTAFAEARAQRLRMKAS